MMLTARFIPKHLESKTEHIIKREVHKKKTSELKDLLNRQNAILENRRIIATLADKGEKVRQRQQMLKV